MTALCLFYILPMMLLTYSQHYQVTATQLQDHPHSSTYFKNLPCPNHEDIKPCECDVDDGEIFMNCYPIDDEQQLYDIFHADIPVTTMKTLYLDTDNVETLRNDVFGNVTFEEVSTSFGSLRYVEPETFIKSVSTLRSLKLDINNITDISDFPLETLTQYTKLETFSLAGNPLSSFPIIYSETIRDLDLSRAAYDTIPDGALNGLPNLEIFWAAGLELDSMANYIFPSLTKIQEIHLAQTGLEHLEMWQFYITSADITYIDLYANYITTVGADVFIDAHSAIYDLDLGRNQITTLPETTWRPLIFNGVTLLLDDNPLDCGCDVAWFVLDPTFHGQIKNAVCPSGDNLVDLDPTWFENNC